MDPKERVGPVVHRAWLREVGIGLGMAIMGLTLLVWLRPSGRAESPQAPQGAGAPVMVVTIKGFEFTPPAVTIAAGGTVRWINADVANHQVSSGVVERDRPRPDGRIASPLLYRDEAFTATFVIRGEYPYYCSVHPFMHGTIRVR